MEPARLIEFSAEDEAAFQMWVSASENMDEWRGELIPTEPSFLSAADCKALVAELKADVYPHYCTCDTELGVRREKWDLMQCEAADGCRGLRWFHRECGHEPDEVTNVFVCRDCKARLSGNSPP